MEGGITISEEQEKYGTFSEQETKLIFTAKRLSDIAKDLDELSEEDKRFVIEKVEKLNAIGIVELYNALGNYMNYY